MLAGATVCGGRSEDEAGVADPVVGPSCTGGGAGAEGPMGGCTARSQAAAGTHTEAEGVEVDTDGERVARAAWSSTKHRRLPVQDPVVAPVPVLALKQRQAGSGVLKQTLS